MRYNKYRVFDHIILAVYIRLSIYYEIAGEAVRPGESMAIRLKSVLRVGCCWIWKSDLDE